MKSTVIKKEYLLNNAIKNLKMAERMTAKAHRVVDRLSEEIEELQLKIEEELGEPWTG